MEPPGAELKTVRRQALLCGAHVSPWQACAGATKQFCYLFRADHLIKKQET
jgi:hypothetical protein